eukprot:2948-Chlamydomonas_euryale.AAC.1
MSSTMLTACTCSVGQACAASVREVGTKVQIRARGWQQRFELSHAECRGPRACCHAAFLAHSAKVLPEHSAKVLPGHAAKVLPVHAAKVLPGHSAKVLPGHAAK